MFQWKNVFMYTYMYICVDCIYALITNAWKHGVKSTVKTTGWVMTLEDW